MADFSSVLSGAGGAIKDTLIYVVYGFVVLGIILAIYYHQQNKKIYKFKVRLFKRRENGKRTEANYKAGYIKNAHGISQFVVKLGRMPWQKKVIHYLPDSNYMDEEDRVYYEAFDPDNWVQMKRVFMEKRTPLVEVELLNEYQGYPAGFQGQMLLPIAQELVENGIAIFINPEKVAEVLSHDVYYEPIPADRKAIVVAELIRVKNALGADNWKNTAVWVGGAVLIVIMTIISYYFISNKGLT